MRILMISDVYFPRINGVSTSIQTFRRELQLLGVDSTLIAPAYDQQDKVIYDVEEEIIRIPSRQVMFDPEDRLLKKSHLDEILHILSSSKFDLLHIQTPFVAHFMGMKLASALGLPVVETYHTFFEEYFYHYIPFLPKSWLRFAARWFSRKQCNQLDALVVPSTAMLEKLRDYGINTHMKIIPTGVSMPSQQDERGHAFRSKHSIPQGRPVLLHVGRVAFEKNIDFLLEMYCEVKKGMPEVILVIAGEGPAKKSLQRKAVRLGIADGVYFVGYLDRHKELLACYAAGDIFVFASRTETQGLVLLEAMATGLPVVSTAEMGTRDILLARRGGVIADEDIYEFSSRVIGLLKDRTRLEAMSQEAVSYAAEWSPATMAGRMREYYHQLITPGVYAVHHPKQAGNILLTDEGC